MEARRNGLRTADHRPAQDPFKGLRQTEELFQCGQVRTRREVDQKIGIAGGRIKVVAARGGPEHLQARHAKTAAYRSDDVQF